MWYLSNGDLLMVLNYFSAHRGQIQFGIQYADVMGDLTYEDIAYAWLNPQDIEEVK